MNTHIVSDQTSSGSPGLNQDAAIHFEQVSVCYRVPRERVSGIKEFAIRWLQKRLEYESFWALQGVGFQVQKGEAFGVIGRNGAGKSTLLKVVARVLVPIKGRVITRGRIAPLIELGAGFNFELTGRENIYLNGALLGYKRKEMDQLYPSIVDFSEIGGFIDAPMRTYSTGMVARLGFSVATCSRPGILLVDEVLSVGDSAFQEKCIQRMQSYRAQGTTIVFVSHNMEVVKWFCNRAIWLNEGRIMAGGDAPSVVERYLHDQTISSGA